jgi:hypothetical protein
MRSMLSEGPLDTEAGVLERGAACRDDAIQRRARQGRPASSGRRTQPTGGARIKIASQVGGYRWPSLRPRSSSPASQ